MPHAVRINEHGGPEVLSWEEIPLGDPGPGEVRINQSHVGLNFIDIYQRTGLYPMDLPATLGMEAAGKIDAVGDGVTEFSIGDRVAYAAAPPGAYTDIRIIPEDRVVPLMDQPIRIDRDALVLGYAGVYSSFLLFAQRAAEKYGVSSRDILVEMGRRKTVGGQEDMIEDVALDLAKQQSASTNETR